MRTIKTKKKAYELAEKGLLFVISEGRYVRANVGLVISSFDVLKFYVKSSVSK